jgi:ABC-type sugar transport system ATPase subunit
MLKIARSLRRGARFIILDEQTARLEAREIEHLFEHIKELKRAGVTFLFISHYLEEIYEFCERVAVLRDGHAANPCWRRASISPAESGSPLFPRIATLMASTAICRSKRISLFPSCMA